jgi:hypothetical protein
MLGRPSSSRYRLAICSVARLYTPYIVPGNHRVLVDRALERCHAGDVDLSADEPLVGPIENQAGPRRARSDIGGDRDVSTREHLAEHLRTDAAVGAGDEEALLAWRGHDHLRKR